MFGSTAPSKDAGDARTANNSSSAHAIPTTTSRSIDFITENDDQQETVILIHGACASGSDWSLVAPYLSSYHLLIPSLFTKPSLAIVRATRHKSTTGSSTVRRWDSCYVSHLADLIKLHAKNGRAHVVGLSFGGCLAVKLTALHIDLCMSLFVSGVPTLVAPPLYSVVKPFGTGIVWLSHVVVKVIGGKNVNKFLEGEVDTDPGAWDGRGGGATFEMNSILTETIIYRGHGEFYAEGVRPSAQTTARSPPAADLNIRFVAASRKSRWTPVSDSPEWATEVGKIMIGEKRGACDPEKGDAVDGIDIKVYEAKRMFHPWNRQDPELFAQCILATILGTEFPAQGVREVWSHSFASASV